MNCCNSWIAHFYDNKNIYYRLEEVRIFDSGINLTLILQRDLASTVVDFGWTDTWFLKFLGVIIKTSTIVCPK